MQMLSPRSHSSSLIDRPTGDIGDTSNKASVSSAPNTPRHSAYNDPLMTLLEGWVEKEGDWIHTFRRRFATITEVGTFNHYLTEQDADSGRAPRGSVSLLHAKVMALQAPNGSNHPFAICLQDGKLITVGPEVNHSRTGRTPAYHTTGR